MNLGLLASFDKTSLDVENSDYIYLFPPSNDESTNYPVYTTGTPSIFANPTFARRFSQLYFPNEQYLDTYSIAGESRFTENLGRGRNMLSATDFDVTAGRPNGFTNKDISTSYGIYTTGTPTIFANPAYPQRFTQRFFPFDSYLDIYSIAGNSRFTEDLGNGLTTLDITNFDLESSNPQGFFRQDTSTVYSPNVTGTPLPGVNPGPPTRYKQRFIPSSPYIASYPMNGLISRFTEDLGNGLTTFSSTNLDVQEFSFPTVDSSTNYPPLTTGTPTFRSNPGPATQFVQNWDPFSTYLSAYPIAGESRFTKFFGIRSKQNSFAITNLDITNRGVDGGIPYNQDKDPTVYPVTSTGATPNRGYFATTGKPVSKFNQVFSPTNTYSDFINAYI